MEFATSTSLSENASAIAFEMASDAFAITDDRGSIVACNRAMEKLTSSSRCVLIGKTIDVLADESRYRVTATVTSFSESVNEPSGLLICYRPATATAGADQANAVASMAAKVGHNLNNVMTVVSGYCEIVLASMDRAHPLHFPLTEILNAGERGRGLANQLLALGPNTLKQNTRSN